MSNPDFDSPEQQYEVLFERQVRARTEELSAALEKLGEESMRFRQLAEHIQGVFYLTDPDNRQMLYVSPAYEAIWGRGRKSLYANPRSWADAVLPEDRERVRTALEKQSITGSFNEEYRISRPYGAVHWIQARSFPVQDKTGAIYRVAGIAEDVTEMRKAQEELRLTNEKLRQLSVRLLAVREEERRRVAREIHDELGAMLTALKLDVSYCVQRLAPHLGNEERETIGKTIRAIDASIEAVRRIATDLRPSILDDFGPWAAIEWLAERLLKRAGLRCDVMIEPAAEKTVLDQERGTALFRIVQEALTNMVRHSRASEVRVQAQLLSNLLVVEVCDNGGGIPGTQSGDAAGFGVTSMSERARSLGGKLAVSGVAGQGTTVRIELPVKGSSASQNT
ncbi:MAG: PAS domain-containing protein [Pseudomonadota bacterium]